MSFEASKTVTQEFFEYLVESHSLGHDGFHGKDHCLRVLQNAREIAVGTGANLRVLELFAVLHDSRRENENHDPEHGLRAAARAEELRGTGPVTVWCRSFDHVMCSKGDEPWAQAERMNFARTRCGSR